MDFMHLYPADWLVATATALAPRAIEASLEQGTLL